MLANYLIAVAGHPQRAAVPGSWMRPDGIGKACDPAGVV